ncbi:MAG: hypothetical protein ABIN08_07800 [Caldimonas sp.]
MPVYDQSREMSRLNLLATPGMPHAYRRAMPQHLQPLRPVPRPLQHRETPNVAELLIEVLDAWTLVLRLCFSAARRKAGAAPADAFHTRIQGEATIPVTERVTFSRSKSIKSRTA